MTAGYANAAPSQRIYFRNAKTLCPLCGGHSELHSHQNIRCIGYMTPGSICCSRVQSPNPGPLNTYRHRRRGQCECGAEHEYAPTPVQAPRASTPKASSKDRPANPLREAIRTIDFLTKDINGNHLATHRRFEFSDRPKTYRWLLPSGQWGLGGGDPRDLPLYGSEDIPTWPLGSTVILTEGEPARDSLKARGIYSLAVASGASNCPNAHIWEDLRGYNVVQWPDADEEGAGLMVEAAARMSGVVIDLWRLDVSQFAPHFDAADWAGTDTELHEFLLSARQPDPPSITEAEGDAAVAAVVAGADAYTERRALRAARASSRRDELSARVDLVPGFGKMAEAMDTCGRIWQKTICVGCGKRPAFTMTCHETLCPNCYGGRFIAHWRQKFEAVNTDKSFNFLICTPKSPDLGDGRFRRTRERFVNARKAHYIDSGVVGAVNSRTHGVQIIMALPESTLPPTELGSFDCEMVGSGDVSNACFWFIERYDAEIDEFLVDEEPGGDVSDELRSFIFETKGRHRFNGFGKLYPTYSPTEDTSTTSGVSEPVPVNLGLIRGGNGGGMTKQPAKTCPFCETGRLARYAERATVTEIRTETHNGHSHACWVPREEG